MENSNKGLSKKVELVVKYIQTDFILRLLFYGHAMVLVFSAICCSKLNILL
jgi:hypothetical protein